MDPLAAKLIIDELRKLRNKFDAWFAKQDAALETSRGIPVPTQSAAIRADVVADNWDGLFDGDDDSIEQQYKAPIVADNWGGLFEQPTHGPEERDLGLSVINVFGSAQICNEQSSHTSEGRGLDLTADVVFSGLAFSIQIRISELEDIPTSDRQLEVLEVDEKVHPSTGSEVLKAVVAKSNADQLLTKRSPVTVLDRNSIVQRSDECEV